MTVPRDTISDTQVPDTLSQTWDLSTGLTKQAAADRLGVATKTLERRASTWGIRSAPYRRPTGGAVLVVYHPGDVANAVTAVKRTALAGILVPDPDVGSNGNGHRPSQALARTPDPEDLDHARLVATLRMFAEMLGHVSQTLSQTPERPYAYLTVRQVATELQLPIARTRARIQAGALAGKFQVERGWRIQRKDLELV